MNRLKYFVCAKTQYNIQSPFLYDLYCNVVVPRLDDVLLRQLGLDRHDRYGQLLYKLGDHYNAHRCEPYHGFESADDFLTLDDGSNVALIRSPHCSKEAEKVWNDLVKMDAVTLSIDLFDIGLLFTSKKLSKQHFLLR